MPDRSTFNPLDKKNPAESIATRSADEIVARIARHF
jgi:hypothetical protein